LPYNTCNCPDRNVLPYKLSNSLFLLKLVENRYQHIPSQRWFSVRKQDANSLPIPICNVHFFFWRTNLLTISQITAIIFILACLEFELYLTRCLRHSSLMTHKWGTFVYVTWAFTQQIDWFSYLVPQIQTTT